MMFRSFSGGVLLVLRGAPLFRHCSGVFHCSAGVLYSVLIFCCSAGVPCSGVPGFIVRCLFLLYSNVSKRAICLKFFCDGN